MRPIRTLAFTAVLATICASPAAADVTFFVGSAIQPENRPVKGLAVGAGVLFLGFEFEYADTSDAPAVGAPGIRTGMGNVLLQTPVPIAGLQFYVTTGGGIYRERLGSRYETQFGVNSGGGVKILLAGPLRARVDYRVFKLNGEPLHSVVHRVYAGLNLAF
jgi:hypothetical protein